MNGEACKQDESYLAAGSTSNKQTSATDNIRSPTAPLNFAWPRSNRIDIRLWDHLGAFSLLALAVSAERQAMDSFAIQVE